MGKRKGRNSQIFNVEYLVDKKESTDGKGLVYLVKWAGWSHDNNTWEPPENFFNQGVVDELNERLVAGETPPLKTPAKSTSSKKTQKTSNSSSKKARVACEASNHSAENVKSDDASSSSESTKKPEVWKRVTRTAPKCSSEREREGTMDTIRNALSAYQKKKSKHTLKSRSSTSIRSSDVGLPSNIVRKKCGSSLIFNRKRKAALVGRTSMTRRVIRRPPLAKVSEVKPAKVHVKENSLQNGTSIQSKEKVALSTKHDSVVSSSSSASPDLNSSRSSAGSLKVVIRKGDKGSPQIVPHSDQPSEEASKLVTPSPVSQKFTKVYWSPPSDFDVQTWENRVVNTVSHRNKVIVVLEGSKPDGFPEPSVTKIDKNCTA